MNLGKRPLSILVLSCLYIAIGIMGFAYHFPRPLAIVSEWPTTLKLIRFAEICRGNAGRLALAEQLRVGQKDLQQQEAGDKLEAQKRERWERWCGDRNRIVRWRYRA